MPEDLSKQLQTKVSAFQWVAKTVLTQALVKTELYGSDFAISPEQIKNIVSDIVVKHFEAMEGKPS